MPISIVSSLALGSHRAALGQGWSACRRGPSRAIALALSGLFAIVPAHAQDREGSAAPTHQRAAADEDRRDITVTGQRPGSTCDGKASTQPIDYACINSQLKTAAASAQPVPSAADAVTSQATTPSKVGTFSFSATSQRMGKNLGHSAQPYRPPAPVYATPAAGPRPK